MGACRQCLVEVEGQRKPMASCTITVTPDMVVRTQYTSEAADKAQRGVMELLLINHPLDCPVCDKGGECPLQNQAMSNGRAETRFEDVKRTFPKPINISSQVLLDRERCVLCAGAPGSPNRSPVIRSSSCWNAVRCNRSASPRASRSSPISPATPCRSARSARSPAPPTGSGRGRSIWCRVPACASTARRDAQRTDHRRGKVLRRLAGDDPQVNEEWNCDKGRWAFTYNRR